MKNQLPTQSALVSIHPCKSQDFLYVIKNALRDELPLYLKQDGNYTLDQSETRKDTARLEMLEQSSLDQSALANENN
jgi:hypothetical protein